MVIMSSGDTGEAIAKNFKGGKGKKEGCARVILRAGTGSF